MAEKQISILLVAKNLASGTIGKVTKDVTTLGKVSNRAGVGLRTLAGNVAKLGAVAAVGLGAAIGSGVDSLATLESAVTSVDGAIKQMGLTGKTTGAQVAGWANEIEANVQSAFDDKDITKATGTLIRYGKVTDANLKPAMQVMTDLAAKTGDVDSAATLLAKALADPVKAAGKLARAGVVLTKSEQDQITALMKAGKTAQAQAVLLRALERTTTGAAAAMNGPLVDAQKEVRDAAEDATRALATGFLPVIVKIADWLKTKLRDPKVIADIKTLGDSLAGIFDQAVTFVTKIPWDSVRSAMVVVGTGAKMALDAFMAMPEWVKVAVISGWGLNKLSGGALGDIVGELGKGLIKGVLNTNVGVMNVNAAVVNGAGGNGIPGTGGGTPGVPAAAGAAGILGPGFIPALAMAAAPIIAFNVIPAIVAGMPGFKPGEDKKPITVGSSGGTIEGWQAAFVRSVTPALGQIPTAIAAGTSKITDASGRDTDKMVGGITAAAGRDTDKLNAGVGKMSAATKASVAAVLAQKATLARVAASSAAGAAAIRAKKFSVTVSPVIKVSVPVSIRDIEGHLKVTNAYKSIATTSSRGYA